MLQNVWQDVRYGFRGLIKRPAFTALPCSPRRSGLGARRGFQRYPERLLDPGPYADATASHMSDGMRAESQPGGRQAFQTAEFPRFPEQPGSSKTSSAAGSKTPFCHQGRDAAVCCGLVDANTFRFWAYRRNSAGALSIGRRAGSASRVCDVTQMWVEQVQH